MYATEIIIIIIITGIMIILEIMIIITITRTETIIITIEIITVIKIELDEIVLIMVGIIQIITGTMKGGGTQTVVEVAKIILIGTKKREENFGQTEEIMKKLQATLNHKRW